MMDSRNAALVEWHAETRASRLPCGSLRTRNHGPHVWTGQSYGQRYTCPGYGAIVAVLYPGQSLVTSVEATVSAYRRGRDEALPRQALEQSSSLVDALLEAAGRHGVDVVQSPGTYRAAEQVGRLLLDILYPARGER